MNVDLDAHRVTKVTITSEQRFQSSSRECISRDLIITFEDGSEQRIDLFASDSVTNLIVEIQ